MRETILWIFAAVMLVIILAMELFANDLSWQDNSTAEDGYVIEMLTGGTWSEVARVGPSVTTYSDAFTEGIYRVWAFKAVPGEADIKSKTPSNIAGKLNAPINLVIK